MNCSQCPLNELFVFLPLSLSVDSSISSVTPLYLQPPLFYPLCFLLCPSFAVPLLDFLPYPALSSHLQAWLTEIHEYAQQDVVVMLLGNKVRPRRQHWVTRGQMDS